MADHAHLVRRPRPWCGLTRLAVRRWLTGGQHKGRGPASAPTGHRSGSRGTTAPRHHG